MAGVSAKTETPGGELERAVLRAVWELGEVSAREVLTHLGRERDLAYTTVATVLDRLHDKRLVARRRVGKAFAYRAAAKREHVTRAVTRDLVDAVLGGVPAPMAALVDAIEDVDPQLIDDLARLVAKKRGARRGA